MSKFLKAIFIILGFVFLMLGALGTVIPILPTVPFLLLTTFFFMKGSDRLNAWIKDTNIYKKHLITYNEKKGLTLKAKLTIIIPVSIFIITLTLIYDIWMMRIFLIVLLLIKWIFFYKMNTLPPEDDEKLTNHTL